MTRDELIRTIAERYSTDPEYPWDDENCIFRHRENRKWFAIVMRVGYRRLGIDREGVADVANVKCGSDGRDRVKDGPVAREKRRKPSKSGEKAAKMQKKAVVEPGGL